MCLNASLCDAFRVRNVYLAHSIGTWHTGNRKSCTTKFKFIFPESKRSNFEFVSNYATARDNILIT